MTLRELNAKLAGGFLRFDCPVCTADSNAHKIRVPLFPQIDRNGRSWGNSGDFPDSLTLTPSVDAGCWHGWVKQGLIAP